MLVITDNRIANRPLCKLKKKSCVSEYPETARLRQVTGVGELNSLQSALQPLVTAVESLTRQQRVNSFLSYSNAARPWPTNGRRQHRPKLPPF